jgi:two-component system sensor histidine kinase and response regulator WspE
VRDLCRQLGKRARLEVMGEDTEVDRDALDSLEGPINHLVRNALDHGVETPEQRAAKGKPEVASICIEARHHAGMLSITISDDGHGIDIEAIRSKLVERDLAKPALASTLSAAELFEFLFFPASRPLARCLKSPVAASASTWCEARSRRSVEPRASLQSRAWAARSICSCR